jgi:hypothetical protein
MARDNKRGYEAQIYSSEDGINFNLISKLTKEEVVDIAGLEAYSIEGTQLLKDPLTGLWYFYLSIDTGKDFVWGGIKWETLLLTSKNLNGPWNSEGLVLTVGDTYDVNQARDATIDIIDGRYFAIYKAKDKDSNRRPALAISRDGIEWKKHGVLKIDGQEQFAFLSGSLFPGVNGPVFLGCQMVAEIDQGVEHEAADKHGVKHGHSLVSFCAYNLDYRNMNLETIFRAKWEPASPYEHEKHPLLGYTTTLHDPNENRILMYVESIDGHYTQKMGLTETVERVLVYDTKL